MVIAVDAFGSDNSPKVEVKGVVDAIKKGFCDKILLTGNKDILSKELALLGYENNQKIELVHTSQTITMDDVATSSVRKKKDSSLVKAIQLVKDKKANAMVSAGNTGAVMSASLFIYGRIKNIKRPAIATIIPTLKKPQILLDAGANVDSTSKNILQFAKIGSIYAKNYLKRKNVRVSLFNIGGEEKKGNELSRVSYTLLKEDKSINFIGNIEGKEFFEGNTDVVVCDGFTGNVILKMAEGSLSFVFTIIKRMVKKNIISLFGLLFFIPIIKYLKNNLNPSKYGGALLVGLNDISIIAHGSSDSMAITNAIGFAKKVVKSKFVDETIELFN